MRMRVSIILLHPNTMRKSVRKRNAKKKSVRKSVPK
jgi:hypothetical protein